jgi:leader peptidase (prepilin peptidase)/N-methyltransferase
MEWVRIGVALVAGAIMGAWIAARIRRDGHRRPDDPDDPVRTIWLIPAVALACAWLVWRLAADPWPVVLLWLPLVPLLAGMSATDLQVRRLPDRRLIPSAAWTAVCVGVLAWQQHSLVRLAPPAIAAVLCAVTFWALHIASRGELGFGDVKLAAILGAAVAAVAWQSVVWALLGACALSLVWAAVTRRRDIAFGPWLALGAIGAVGLPH